MALKIRLRQQGRRNHLTYRLVLADARFPRDGKYLELLGHYDPHLEDNKGIAIKEDRISFWLEHGAVMTEKSEALIAKLAPEIVKSLRKKRQEKRLKLNAKRRAAKKK